MLSIKYFSLEVITVFNTLYDILCLMSHNVDRDKFMYSLVYFDRLIFYAIVSIFVSFNINSDKCDKTVMIIPCKSVAKRSIR